MFCNIFWIMIPVLLVIFCRIIILTFLAIATVV